MFICTFILATSAMAPSPQDSTLADAPVLDDDLGRQVFLRYCRECHGEEGDGLGKFSYTTGERPRSFQSGRFKLATTENLIPSDRDLEDTIRRGMPGTGMSAWAQLPDAEIEAVARYTRSFSLDALRAELEAQVAAGELGAAEADGEFARRTTPGPPIAIPPEPPFDEARRARGERLYLEACASCHGPNGRRLRNDPMPDFEGNHTLPTNIVGGVFKGGAGSAAIYSRLHLGMDGTAMPGYRGRLQPGRDLGPRPHRRANHLRRRSGAARRRGGNGGRGKGRGGLHVALRRAGVRGGSTERREGDLADSAGRGRRAVAAGARRGGAVDEPAVAITQCAARNASM